MNRAESKLVKGFNKSWQAINSEKLPEFYPTSKNRYVTSNFMQGSMKVCAMFSGRGKIHACERVKMDMINMLAQRKNHVMTSCPFLIWDKAKLI